MKQGSDIEAATRRLTELLNMAPLDALAEARRLPEGDMRWRLLRASILCDAGAEAHDVPAVDEASNIFLEALDLEPDGAHLNYNLANALSARASLDPTDGPEWYLKTSELRRRARARYFRAARSSHRTNRELATQAFTNLANELNKSHRWIEAYESYRDALDVYPENGSASGNAAIALFRVSHRQIFGHERHLDAAARRLAHHAQLNEETVEKFAGPHAVETFKRLPSDISVLGHVPDDVEMTAYEEFVASNGLFLAPILEGPGHDRKRWDDAHILRLTDALDAGPEVPPLIAMFNVAKADYLVARRLLYEALHEAPLDTGHYHDTLDYAVYGEGPARLVLAQRAALDILDKIAVALSEHFEIGLRPNAVSFRSIWRLGREPRWRARWREVIGSGNLAVIALSEIANDLVATGTPAGASEAGLLAQETAARNTGTHRFTVLHDMGVGQYRRSDAIEHYHHEAFQGISLRTLKLARAALLHFLEAIAYDEDANDRAEHAKLPMSLVPHHRIRGKDR